MNNIHPDEPAVASVSKSRALTAFLAMAAVYYFSYFLRTAIPGTIFNHLQRDLLLSAGAIAAMGSMFTWIYGGMQLAVGVLADRYGGKKTLLAGGAIMLLGSVLFPFAQSTPALFTARAITGLGASCMYLSIVRELDVLFGRQHFTVWLGILLAVGYSGGITATLPFETAVNAFGWRSTLMAASALLAVSVLIAFLVLSRVHRHERRNGDQFITRKIKSAVKHPSAFPLLASSFIMFPVFFVFQTVLGKKFLQDVAGLDSRTSAAFVMIMTIVSAVSVVLAGWLPRFIRNRRKPIILTGAVILVSATLLLASATLFNSSGWVYLTAYILLALSVAATPAATAVMREISPSGSSATAISMLNALAYLGSGTVGQCGGLILNIYSKKAVLSGSTLIYPMQAYTSLSFFLTALALINLLLLCLVKETHGSHNTDVI